MQGLEFVDVPGLSILAIGTGLMGAMLLLSLGWRKRDREVVERLHVERPDLLEPIEPAVDVTAFAEPDELTAPEVSGCFDSRPVEPQALMCSDDHDTTPPYGYTSADLAQCRAGLEVKPFRRNSCG